MRRVSMMVGAALWLGSCDRSPTEEAGPPRPVRTTIAARGNSQDTVLLTGHVAAQDEAAMAFRISGRMIERSVNVGDHVEGGQIIARLDPQNETNSFRSAQASVAAAQASLNQTRAQFERQRTLLAQGHTPRAQFDIAEAAMRTSQAQLDDAEAQLQIAADRVGFTMLVADAPGTVTARGAEPGEVVQAGQMIVQLARKGGTDAVFDVPAQLLPSLAPNLVITVALPDDPSAKAIGRVREVSPQADPVTRTFTVRVGLTGLPDTMRLGATVNGSWQQEAGDVITLPASALTEADRQPAVWVVDPKQETVSTRTIELVRHDPGTIVVAHGLENGDIVVTAGVQALHPGQKVRLLGPAG